MNPPVEPIYEYVRGKGWEPTTPNTVTMACGTVVIVEQRMAKRGETFCEFYSYHTLDYLMDKISRKQFSSLSNQADRDRVQGLDCDPDYMDCDPDYMDCVITPVNV